jgi:hypothetical protein
MTDPSSIPPALSPDFAERVLRRVDGVKRRRRWVLGLGVMGLVVLTVLAARGPARPSRTPELAAAEFSGLGEMGTSTSTPSALLFPDEAEVKSGRQDGWVVIARGL